MALVGAKDEKVRVFYQIDTLNDLVLVDKVQIQQVLVNLIRNGIEAMSATGGGELTVSTQAADDGWLTFSVADAGSGIAPEIKDQLFQPFMTTKRNGMGVGLSISRTIVEAHGGKIWVEQNPGSGTIFRFSLPAVTTEEMQNAV